MKFALHHIIGNRLYGACMWVTLVTCMWAFCGCTEEDTSPMDDKADLPSSHQVTIIFNPGQIGDQGYADCILGSLSQLGEDTDAGFLSYNTLQETTESIQKWFINRQNPFLGGNYQHRLLILTDANQAKWLKGVSCDDNDEILMLNTPQAMVDSLAEAGWDNHVHALNISVANEMKRYCQFVTQNNEEVKKNKAKIYIIQENEEDKVADSIFTTINNYKEPESKTAIETSLINLSIYENNDSIFDYTQASQYAIGLALFFYALLEKDVNAVSYTIINHGIYGGGFKAAEEFMGTEYNRTLYMDSEINGTSHQKYIKRLYDKAIIAWVKQWTTQQAMPRIIWHGEWDGYTNCNF